MTSRVDRALMVSAPLVAMAAVGLGLRIGAPSAVRAAVVFGAPRSDAATGLSWQVVVFDEDHGVREPVALPEIDATAWADGSPTNAARWRGATNEDGTAEMLLSIPRDVPLRIEIRAGGALLAGGHVEAARPTPRPPPASAWTRFARREGPIALDVAVVGQRVASGFPSSIWVRATDEATHAAITGARVEAETDASLSVSAAEPPTDDRGWTHIVATPMGHAVALVLHARAVDGRTGAWAGALFVSPGAAHLEARDRYSPDEEPAIDVVVPNLRTTAYIEVDDVRGRAWAAAVPLDAREGSMPRAAVHAPRLAPGLYWAVAAGDASGGASLGPGTAVRPFFVAATDAEALSFGTDAEACASGDRRDAAQTVAVCLALAAARPVPRWIAVDGFAAKRTTDAQRRSTGLTLALAAIATAVLLETALLLRTAMRARARLLAASSDDVGTRATLVEHASRVAIPVLVALLGFALMAAFLLRIG